MLDYMSTATQVQRVTVYGNFSARTLNISEALAYCADPGREVTLMLGAMQPGYLGREVITEDDLRRWAKPKRINYHRLTPAARSEIQWAGFTVAEYVRTWYPDGEWGGDRCGCPDDRCRDGHHHDPNEDCDCLTALLRAGVENGKLGR
jgi:hypothetical protein